LRVTPKRRFAALTPPSEAKLGECIADGTLKNPPGRRTSGQSQ